MKQAGAALNKITVAEEIVDQEISDEEVIEIFKTFSGHLKPEKACEAVVIGVILDSKLQNRKNLRLTH